MKLKLREFDINLNTEDLITGVNKKFNLIRVQIAYNNVC
jgi:hypothetical protein